MKTAYSLLSILTFAICLSACGVQSASGVNDINYTCADGGTAIIIKIDTMPTFASSRDIKQGVELSHTIFYGSDIKTSEYYQVSVDNVFAKDFNVSSNEIPNSYDQAFQVGKVATLCGLTYSNPLGIHWVHTNCNSPTSGPTGYVIINGINYTNSTDYCYLFTQPTP